MYFSLIGWDVFISRSKKKLPKNGKRGWVNKNIFMSAEKYRKEFGISNIMDLDQKIMFKHDLTPFKFI
jgi:hypothetical protein